jgi:small subunit ribosomal protein S9
VTDEPNIENEPASEVSSDALSSESAPEETSEATQPVEAAVTTDGVVDAVAESGGAVAGDEPAAADAEPVVVDPTEIVEGDIEFEYIEETPREKPAIPGADLIPDLVSDGSDFLDAEARAAAEAEAEEAAARATDAEPELVAEPIAQVTIDLAAGARYTATGKRKSGVARVILKPGTGTYLINGKSLEEYFPRDTLQRNIRQPLEAVGYEARMDVIARMHGGGVSSQAGALRHGISRALLEADPNLRGELKRRGFLTRDPRVKERKKAGLKKARKRPQFSKR